MDQILLGVVKCVCKQDDILIGGNDWQENLRILADVLDRLHKYNLHLKLPKCEFLKPEVVYLGLRISAEGLQPVEEKINAVKQAPAPQNVSELRSFLGMSSIIIPFLPGLATILAPLHRLLQKMFDGNGQMTVRKLSRHARRASPVIRCWSTMI